MKKKLLLQDLSDFLVLSENVSKKDADAFVRAFFDIIEQGLLEDKFVKIKGFGTFKLVAVNERESVNINTGERFQISGHTKVTFTPDSTMKEMVNRPFAHFEAVDLNDGTDMEELNLVDQDMAAEDFASPETEEDEDVETEALAIEETEESGNTASTAPQPSSISEKGISALPAEKEQENEEDATGQDLTDDISIELLEEENLPDEEVKAGKPNPISQGDPEEQEGAFSPAITQAEQHTRTVSVENEEEDAKEIEPQADSHQEGTTANSDAESESTYAGEAAEEEIVVTAPKTITPHNESGNESGYTSNSIGYTYNEVPLPPKRNKWKIAFFAFCLILLMAACYFAGYFRLLCPCSFPAFASMFETEQAPQAEQRATSVPQAAKPAAPQATADTVRKQNPDSTQSVQASPAASLPTSQQTRNTESLKRNTAESPAAKPQPATQTSPTAAKTQREEQKAPSATKEKQSEAAQTERVHVVKEGDTLLKISRRYYNSENYVKAIMKRNNLKDANNIPLGIKLTLP